MRLVVVTYLVLALCGCGTPPPLKLFAADNGKQHAVTAGQQIKIRLVAFAGSYSLKSISSTAVEFLEVHAIPPYLPSGPDLLFTFEAVHRGTAKIEIEDAINDKLFVAYIDVD